MFIATNRIRVKKGAGHYLEQRFSHRRGIENRPGFVTFALWKLDDDQAHEEYLVVTHWGSKDDFSAWTESPEFREAHSRPWSDSVLDAEFRGYEVCFFSEPAQAPAA